MTEPLSNSVYDFCDREIAPFLKNLIHHISERTLEADLYQPLFEYYISQLNSAVSPPNEEEEMKKFFTLGWFVYSNLKNDHFSPSP